MLSCKYVRQEYKVIREEKFREIIDGSCPHERYTRFSLCISRTV